MLAVSSVNTNSDPFFSNCVNNDSAERERIEEILDIAERDDTALSLIENVLSAVSSYIEAICNMEGSLSMQRFRLEGEEIRVLTEKLDGKRRRKHNVLIDSIKIANRYLFKKFGTEIPVGGIYSSDPLHLCSDCLNRDAIGDWAERVAKVFSNLHVRIAQ